MTQINIDKLIADTPLVQDLIDLKQVTWFNPNSTTTQAGLPYVGLTLEDVQDAEARLTRFAPYLMKAFPETQTTQGIIESDVVAIPNMQSALETRYETPITGEMLLKKIATYLFRAQ